MSEHLAVAAVSRESFLENLQESGLLAAGELRQTLESLAANPGLTDGGGIAQQLISAGRLTLFQAVAIMERRFSELRIGNYDVLEKLGAGGMGTVLKARHRRMKRIVALKVLAREVAKESSFVQRFQREVETIAQLSHPNIVMAFDADEAEIGPFLVMEFVNGHDLGTEVQRHGPESIAQAADDVLQSARGLAYAHAQGIVHRDIKPSNLLRDQSGLVKVADLGLARLSSTHGQANNSLTQSGGIVGTTDYMPPEQAVDATTIDGRADIYSLGCTLHYLAAGRAPFEAGSVMAVLLKHREAAIPLLRDVRSEVPAELDEVYQRMMAKKAEDRFQSMNEVVQRLEELRGLTSKLTGRGKGGQPQGAHMESVGDATVAAGSWNQLGASSPSTDTTPSGASAPPSPSLGGRVADLTVVLVEPSRTQAGIIRKYLAQLGIARVEVTGSGQKALEIARQSQAQVFLSSLHLADMSGVQLAQVLHADPSWSGVGFVLATSESDTEAVHKLLKLPRVVLMPKPFDLNKLAQALSQATGRA